jgi:very-short-patch-repair endonuclease
MNLLQNDWDRLRAHYRQYADALEEQDSDEWAIDAYAWETGMMQMTPIEAWLWADIRQANAVFYPQYPIGRFFVDFANPKAKVVIECDGAAYHLDKAKDAARDAELERKGWTVYRITGAECFKEFD